MDPSAPVVGHVDGIIPEPSRLALISMGYSSAHILSYEHQFRTRYSLLCIGPDGRMFAAQFWSWAEAEEKKLVNIAAKTFAREYGESVK